MPLYPSHAIFKEPITLEDLAIPFIEFIWQETPGERVELVLEKEESRREIEIDSIDKLKPFIGKGTLTGLNIGSYLEVKYFFENPFEDEEIEEDFGIELGDVEWEIDKVILFDLMAEDKIWLEGPTKDENELRYQKEKSYISSFMSYLTNLHSFWLEQGAFFTNTLYLNAKYCELAPDYEIAAVQAMLKKENYSQLFEIIRGSLSITLGYRTEVKELEYLSPHTKSRMGKEILKFHQVMETGIYTVFQDTEHFFIPTDDWKKSHPLTR